jgi:3-phosphoshikimate 1-carboxyvinyltransferase
VHWCLLGTAHRAFGNYVLIQCPSGRNRLWQNFFTRGAERYLQVETYEVRPAYAGGRKLNAAVSVPGSKSITNRALMLAALADGTTTLRGALMSDDSRAFIGCLQNLGFPVEADEEKKTVRVTGFGGTIPKKEASINVGSAGTAARFITALLGFVPGIWHLDASEQMKKRPMKPLLRSLETLGSRIEYHGEPGFFPFTIHSDGVKTDEVSVNIDDSSQFLSALMMASLTLKRPFVIRVLGSHGLSYVQMTVKLMRDFGAEVKEISSENSRSPLCLSISLPGQLRTGAFDVEPDVSAAAYFYACAAITGGKVLVRGVHSDSLQGDLAFLGLLEEMGCTSSESSDGISIQGPAGGRLHAVTADLHSFSDQALTLAAIAPFADSPVTIQNIGHIRLQECDRIHAITANLSAMGIKAEDLGVDIRITPGTPHGARIQTYSDHRVAMAFAVPGIVIPGIVIENPQCCRKTFAEYFDVLTQLTNFTD